MKALSLWEPWATFMALGLKKVETRSWKTDYRGPLLICAAKRKMTSVDTLFRREVEITSGLSIEPHYGLALCVVNLIRCDLIREFFPPTVLEHFLGNYTPGRYAWTTTNLRLINPFPVTGSQGLFEVEYQE